MLDLAQASPAALTAEQTANAAFGLGESLQRWAEAVVAATGELPDAQLTPQAEAQAKAQAAALFQQSVQAYQQVASVLVSLGAPPLRTCIIAVGHGGNNITPL